MQILVHTFRALPPRSLSAPSHKVIDNYGDEEQTASMGFTTAWACIPKFSSGSGFPKLKIYNPCPQILCEVYMKLFFNPFQTKRNGLALII